METVETATGTNYTALVNYDEAQPYLVNDYPYGGKRCRIRFWIEYSPNKGYRFVSQTENPKTLHWNAPKKSTYAAIAGAMYLDEKGHVQWDQLTLYSDADKVLAFVAKHCKFQRFHLIAPVVLYRIKDLERTILGLQWVTMNGTRMEYTEAQKKRDQAEVLVWRQADDLLKALA